MTRRRSARATKGKRKGKRKPSPSAAATADAGMSIAAFARDRNVDEKAVRKAIKSERIPPTCVGLSSTGRRQVITDVAAARAAWDANASRIPHGAAVEGERASLSEASRLATMERHRALRLKNDLNEGLVLSVPAAKREAFESYRIIRDAVLNVSTRYAEELAAETDPARLRARLDDILREALGEAADRLEASGE